MIFDQAPVAADDREAGDGAATLARPGTDGAATRAARLAPLLLLECDRDGVVSFCEGGLLDALFPGGVVGRHLGDLLSPPGAPGGPVARLLSGEAVSVEVDLAGHRLEVAGAPRPGGDGSQGGYALVAVDVTARAEADEAVAASVRRQSLLLEHVSDVILVLTGAGMVRSANPAAERVLGRRWRPGETIDPESLVHPDDLERCRALVEAILARPGAQPPERLRVAHADGSFREVEVVGDNLTHDPAVAGIVVTLHDVTDERRSEARLLDHATRQAALAELGRWALAGVDYPSLLEDAVKVLRQRLPADTVHVFESFLDASLLSLSARFPHLDGEELVSAEPTSSPASFALVTQQTVVSNDLDVEARFDVPELWTRSRAVSVIEAPIPGQDMPVGVLGVTSRRRAGFGPDDVNFVEAVANVLAAAASRVRAEEAIRAQALTDPLTGLANRLFLASRRAGGAPVRPEWNGRDHCVLVVDVDRFKEINETLGHAVGDRVLVEVARRLERIGDPVAVVARLGADEFALVCRRLEDEAAEDDFAGRLRSVVGEPLAVAGLDLRLRSSIGISALGPSEVGEVPLADLLRRAETAMFQAKREHVGIRRYSDDLERSSLARLALASELSEAIDAGELRLDYQPKVDVETRRAAGVEALVRWQHPTRGLLLPDVFVPLAEQTGLVRELTAWVLARAFAECASWQRAGYEVPVAVNLSAATVHDPSLPDAVMSAVSRAGLAVEAVELEITESAVMADPEGAIARLEELTGHGVRFALDDFGTGYSSLAYLQRLPVSSVKIDKSFVRPLGGDAVAREIVRAVADLGHSLDLSVVAEGVDSEEVLEATGLLGCDAVQGYHVAVPMTATALREWLAGPAGRPEDRPAGPAQESAS
ncbi:MAG TPA: EAL domain-containing protein [Acidimicrobiales bacterium]|nr:EAL domain-containing protein [Acidimicrobiales bacterium]